MNKHAGSTLDSLFEELGELEEVDAKAAKKILAIRAERRMKELGLTTTTLAARMRTSRNQIHRILDRDDAGVTLKMLFRLGRALRLPVRVEFEPIMEPRRRSPTRRSIGAAGSTTRRRQARPE